jgi:hypothetical protein
LLSIEVYRNPVVTGDTGDKSFGPGIRMAAAQKIGVIVVAIIKRDLEIFVTETREGNVRQREGFYTEPGAARLLRSHLQVNPAGGVRKSIFIGGSRPVET